MASVPINQIPLNQIDSVVGGDLCVSCGFCSVSTISDENLSVSFRLNPASELVTPVLEDINPVGKMVVCPGAKMDMVLLHRAIYGELPADQRVGNWLSIDAGWSTDDNLRLNSASGGITTVLVKHLLETGAVDVAYLAVNKGKPEESRGALIFKADDLVAAQDSIYHPVEFGAALKTLIESDLKFVFVGLPCEIAALASLKLARPDVSERNVLTIGLFCGGINRFEGIKWYMKTAFNTPVDLIKKISYRAGYWPGYIQLETDTGKYRIPRIRGNKRWKILRYVSAFQGYWMLPRCRMCPDQISDFADISVGDPHLKRFKREKNKGVSAIIARSKRGLLILNELRNSGQLHFEKLTRDELIASQGYTLDNRRHAIAYTKVASKLGMKSPNLEVYPVFRSFKWYHLVYAWVDMTKIKVRKYSWLRPVYLPWQIFEYLFITFSPRIFATRLKKILGNK